jgi:hypothetical protein
VFSRLNASFSREQSWPQVTFGNGLAPNVLGRNLMLLDFFGQHVPTVSELARAETFVVELEEAREEVSKRTSSRASRISSEKVESDRAAIERYLEAHPGASRSQVLRELGKTAVRARDNDTAWYDLRFPARRRGKHLDDVGLEATLYLAYLDDKLSAHVRARHTKLSTFQGWAPKSITKTALLRGTPRANEVTNELLLKLPKTKAAIEECVETRDQFKRRLALTVLQQRSMPISELVYDVRRRTNLSLREIHILNAELIGKNV